jgi:two-component system, OmpR family, KDP operon response regulator KdpE
VLTELWGPAAKETHALRVHIAHLRDKIENNPGSPQMLITESGVGYRLLEDPCSETPASRA